MGGDDSWAKDLSGEQKAAIMACAKVYQVKTRSGYFCSALVVDPEHLTLIIIIYLFILHKSPCHFCLQDKNGQDWQVSGVISQSNDKIEITLCQGGGKIQCEDETGPKSCC